MVNNSALRVLATAIEGGDCRADRLLDADLFEALGYQVQREPVGRSNFAWRYFDQQGRRWLTLPHFSSIDECSRFIEQFRPRWAWSVGNTGPEDQPHACVTLDNDACTDFEGSAHSPALALTAAFCRAVAK